MATATGLAAASPSRVVAAIMRFRMARTSSRFTLRVAVRGSGAS
jgi:hypothetical protein